MRRLDWQTGDSRFHDAIPDISSIPLLMVRTAHALISTLSLSIFRGGIGALRRNQLFAYKDSQRDGGCGR